VRVLVVEDETLISRQLERALGEAGYAVDCAADGERADFLGQTEHYDAVVLDLGLPKVDGLTLLRRWRDAGIAMPVLVLTARGSWHEKVQGIDGGADDYVAKPFRFEELLARVRVRLRSEGTAEQTVLRAGDVALDLRTRRATVDGRTVELSAREFTMLEVFLRHAGQVLAREQLLSHVWGYDYDPGSNVVDVYVGYLRRKLGKERIVTVRGMGYALEA
jgi:DNA-binding response OmpR family regulator